jgi:FimV-like protein
LPNSWGPFNELAWANYKLGRMEDAKKQAEKALQLSPNNALVLDTLGLIALDQNEGVLAEKLLTKAMDHMPSNGDIKYHLSKSLIENDKKDDARKILSELLESGVEFSQRNAAKELLNSIGQ